jgi:hypothetical protein
MKRHSWLGSVPALAVAVLAGVAFAQGPAPSPGQAALAEAAKRQQHLFVLVYKQDDAATQAVRQTLGAALAKQGGRAARVELLATDPAEKPLIDQWGLSRAPMPLVLAVAPNGAVTGGFPLKLTEQDVAGAFVSPATAACLKAMQSRKLVLLCVQPPGVTEVPAGVREFKADEQYSPVTEVVTVRGDDPAEADLCKSLQLKPTATTVTSFFAPPSNLLGTFEGAVTKQQLVEKLKAGGGCCCPGGKCGPGGCCAPSKNEPKP